MMEAEPIESPNNILSLPDVAAAAGGTGGSSVGSLACFVSERLKRFFAEKSSPMQEKTRELGKDIDMRELYQAITILNTSASTIIDILCDNVIVRAGNFQIESLRASKEVAATAYESHWLEPTNKNVVTDISAKLLESCEHMPFMKVVDMLLYKYDFFQDIVADPDPQMQLQKFNHLLEFLNIEFVVLFKHDHEKQARLFEAVKVFGLCLTRILTKSSTQYAKISGTLFPCFMDFLDKLLGGGSDSA